MRYWFLFLLLLCSCQLASFPLEVRVVGEWTDNENQIIIDAFDEWEKATAGYTVTDIITHWQLDHEFSMDEDYFHDIDGVLMIYAIPEDHPAFEEINARSEVNYWLGIANESRTIVVRIDGTRYYKNLFKVMLHEIGHIYGLEHSEIQNSIMYKSITDVQKACIDTETLAEFCDLHECSSAVLSTCY